MQLSAQQFSEALASLRASSAVGSVADQRRFNRMEVQAQVVVAALTEGKLARRYTALTRNISFGGSA